MDHAKFVKEKPSHATHAHPIFADVERASTKVDKCLSSKQTQLVFNLVVGVQG